MRGASGARRAEVTTSAQAPSVSWVRQVHRRAADGAPRCHGCLKLAVAIWPLIGFAYATQAIVDALFDPGFAASLAALVVGGAGGGLLYLVFARLLRVGEVQTMLSTITRRLPGRA